MIRPFILIIRRAKIKKIRRKRKREGGKQKARGDRFYRRRNIKRIGLSFVFIRFDEDLARETLSLFVVFFLLSSKVILYS